MVKRFIHNEKPSISEGEFRLTTAEQRKAWADVHNALINYMTNFGPIKFQDDGHEFVLNYDCRFLDCGEIFSEK